MTESAAASSAFDAPMQRIRDAAKWLIGAAAAVGAVLIAGSQLSSIGKLEFGWRLISAVVGVALALVAVVFAVWTAVQVLLPVAVTLAELEQLWEENKRADVRFFHNNPGQLGYPSPEALRLAREDAWRVREEKRKALDAADVGTPASKQPDNRLLVLLGMRSSPAAPDGTAQADKKEDFDDAEARFRRVDDHIRTVLHTAQYQLLQDRFNKVLKKLLWAAVAAAVGIMLYAWAANPPAPPAVKTSLLGADLSGADLHDADLVGADLRDADLTRANLEGADLSEARVSDVTWSDTTCPDGSNSDDHEDTCEGHLGP